MVYIAADGSVGGRKSLSRQVMDFFSGILSLVSLFFATITNPGAIEQQRGSSTSNTRTYGQRNQGRSYRTPGGSNGTGSRDGDSNRRSSNIRGVRDLGSATCRIGGG